MKKFYIYSLIASASFIFGCQQDAARESTERLRIEGNKTIESPEESTDARIEGQFKNDLANTSWTPTFMFEQNGAIKPESNEAFLKFTPDIRIEGMAGNNSFTGDVVISENGSFRAARITTTDKAGQYSDYEYKFLQYLSKANRVGVSSSGKVLKLYNGRRLLMLFKKI